MANIQKKMQKLYESSLAFTLLERTSEKNLKLLLTVGLVNQLSNAVGKAVVFVLLDEADPFFYFSLQLTEDDFNSLKASQGLLVDFLSFPNQTIQLLEKCFAEEKQPNPRFSLLLKKDLTSSQIDVVESNGFRRLVHLSLKFCSATDQALKQHLATAIKNLKEENISLTTQLEQVNRSLTSQVEDLESRLSERSLENERLRIERDEKAAYLSERAQAEISRERQRAAEVEGALKENHSREFSDLRNQYERNLDQLEARLRTAEEENRAFIEQNQRFETTVRDLQAQLKASHEECKSLNYDLMVTRQRATRLDSDLQAQEKSASQVTHKLAVLEKEVREKDVQTMKLRDHLAVALDAERRMTEDIKRLESTVFRREDAVKNITEDLIKANEIISKLQMENNTLNGKLKIRGELVMQQEKVVENRESEVKTLRDEVRKTMEEKLRIDDELKRAKEEIEAGNTKLMDQEKTLKTNETVISWLNQQLTELQVQTGGGQPLSGRQVAASLANVSRAPHLGQLRTRSEDLRRRDSSAENHENEEPLDPIYFQPSPLRDDDHSKNPPSKAPTPPSRETGIKSTNRIGGTRAPFLKSASVGGATVGGKKTVTQNQNKPSAYFAR